MNLDIYPPSIEEKNPCLGETLDSSRKEPQPKEFMPFLMTKNLKMMKGKQLLRCSKKRVFD
jgi:hypothetical protein